MYSGKLCQRGRAVAAQDPWQGVFPVKADFHSRVQTVVLACRSPIQVLQENLKHCSVCCPKPVLLLLYPHPSFPVYQD